MSHARCVIVIKGRGRKLCISEITIHCRYYGIALEMVSTDLCINVLRTGYFINCNTRYCHRDAKDEIVFKRKCIIANKKN